ncbi:MAG TPA: hypothetical protein VGR06_34205, partial [Actinophytocola sp.]|nr:hypothetical protein [Actinophytocola sp.]
MSTLDTRVDGDPGAVRAAAAGLAAVAGGMVGAGSGFATAVSASEVLWSGAAGDAFRFGLQPVRRATDEVAAATQRARQAMDTFADELTAVRTMVERAKSIASAAGLEVGADGIQPPKPPATPPPMCMTAAAATAAADRFAAQLAEYRRQVRAYQQARDILSDARTLERSAHAVLGTALASVREIIDGLSTSGAWLAAGTWGTTMSTSIANADRWAGEQRRLAQTFQRLKAIADSPDVAVAAPELKATATGQAVEKLRGLRQAAARAAANERLAGLGSAAASRTALRGALGKAGPIAAGAAGVYDVLTAHGTGNKIKAAVADGAGYGAGAAAAAGSGSLFAAAGIAGAPETLGTSLIAAGVAYGVSETIKDPGRTVDIAGNLLDDAKDGLGTVANQFTHPS